MFALLNKLQLIGQKNEPLTFLQLADGVQSNNRN